MLFTPRTVAEKGTPTGKEMDKDPSHFRSSFAFMAVQGMHKVFGIDGQIWQRGKV
jgi:hypothetical protein